MDIEELVSLERNIGRPDLAKLLVRYGMTSSIQEAFDRYLVGGEMKRLDLLIRSLVIKNVLV